MLSSRARVVGLWGSAIFSSLLSSSPAWFSESSASFFLAGIGNWIQLICCRNLFRTMWQRSKARAKLMPVASPSLMLLEAVWQSSPHCDQNQLQQKQLNMHTQCRYEVFKKAQVQQWQVPGSDTQNMQERPSSVSSRKLRSKKQMSPPARYDQEMVILLWHGKRFDGCLHLAAQLKRLGVRVSAWTALLNLKTWNSCRTNQDNAPGRSTSWTSGMRGPQQSARAMK